jgi:hypothetical protein
MLGSGLRLLALGLFALSGIFAALGPPTSAQAGCTQTTVTIPTFQLVGSGTYQGAGSTLFTCTGDTINSAAAQWQFATEGTCNATPTACETPGGAGDSDNENSADNTQFSFTFQLFSGNTSDGVHCTGGSSLLGPTNVPAGTVVKTGQVSTPTDGRYCIQFVSSDPALTGIATAHPGQFEIDVIDYGDFNSCLTLASGGACQNGPNGNGDAFISAATPELDSIVLFGAGLVGLVGFGAYQRRKKAAI